MSRNRIILSNLPLVYIKEVLKNRYTKYIEFDGYKIHYTLYRYNIEHNSNTSLSNFVIKSGYSLGDFEHSGG